MLVRIRNIAIFLILLAILAAIGKFYFEFNWKHGHPIVLTIPDHPLNACPKRLDWLNDLSITYPVKYARRDIIVKPNPETTRTSVTKVDATLFPNTQIIDLTASSEVELKQCLEPLVLDVPTSLDQPPDASHIIFGIATLLDRLELSIPFLQRWLAHTNAQLLVIAEGPDNTSPDPEKMAELESTMRSLKIKVTIVKPLSLKDSMPERYFSLVKVLYQHRSPSTQWLSIIDDDTFFPSLQSLVDELSAFDPNKEWYLGALSEEWWPIVRYGLMAFGGAGIFLSLPLASLLDTHYEDCKRRSGAGAGDMRIRECIIWHTDTKLTYLQGLHQVDMLGDRSGLYESGRLHLSLHHWKDGWWDTKGYGTWFPMHKLHLVADICGDCFLQRWQFGKDTVLSNGYSIAEYPNGVWEKLDREGELRKMEYTWNEAGLVEGSNNPGWDHDVGPLRPRLELEREKVQYRFLDAVAVDGGVRQFYLHLGVDGDLDTLLEIFWIRNRDDSTPFAKNGTQT